MAVIGKIQKNSMLLLIVVGLAMLAFIFSDFIKGGGGEEEDQLEIATLHGELIDVDKYLELKEEMTNRQKSEYQYQQKEWNAEAERLADDNAFNELIRRTLLEEEFSKLGIVCTKNELNDMIHGNHLHPWVLQVSIFRGPDGAFSKDSVRSFIQKLEVEPVGASPEQMQNWLDSRKQWKSFEEELENARKADKYVALVKKGIYINKLEAQDQYNALYDKKQVRFVVQRYADIPVDAVKITDEEIKAYYEKHKNDVEYEQEEARDVQMVNFSVAPTPEDIAEINTTLETMKPMFSSTKNDLAFVYQNSDSKFLSDSTAFRMGMDDQLRFSINQLGGAYPRSADEIIQNSKVGDVLGPFPAVNADTRAEEMALVKVVELPVEEQAWVRHILISIGQTRTEEQAKAIGDSLIKVIKAKNNFAELVPKVSEDPGSMSTGGEYKWFSKGAMVPEFEEASFNGKIGDLQLVKTSFGYHIVEVLGQAQRKTPVLALVTKTLKPSDETKKEMESNAFDFVYTVEEATGDSAFNRMAEKANLEVQSARINLSNDYVIGLNNARTMLQFVFSKNAKVGDISKPLIDGDKFVVAIIDNVIAEGVPEFDDVKEIMRGPALKEKQAEVYIKKMSGKNSLEQVGAVVTNGAVGNAELTFASKSIYNGGQEEPYVIGKVFTKIPKGAMTVPIKGEEGIYVFIVDSEIPAVKAADLKITSDPMRAMRANTSDGKVIQALREKANLVDNRRRLEFR